MTGHATWPAPQGQQRRLRAGDTERAQVAAALGEHYAQGRLTLAEFDERSSRALTAVHLDELDPLMADLPSPQSGPSRTSPGPRARPRGPGPLVLVPLLIVLVVLTRGAILWLLPALIWLGGARGAGPWSAASRRACAGRPSGALGWAGGSPPVSLRPRQDPRSG